MSAARSSRWSALTRPRPAEDWTAEDGLGVFVPGLMGAGILLSGAILVSDGVRRLLPSRGVRRRLNVVRGVRRIVVDMADAAGIEIEERNLMRRERRPRLLYAAVGAVSLTLAFFVVRWGFNAFSSTGSSMEGNAMAIFYGLILGAGLTGLGVVTAWLTLPVRAPRHIRWLVRHTVVGRLAPPPEGVAERAKLLIPILDKGASR